MPIFLALSFFAFPYSILLAMAQYKKFWDHAPSLACFFLYDMFHFLIWLFQYKASVVNQNNCNQE